MYKVFLFYTLSINYKDTTCFTCSESWRSSLCEAAIITITVIGNLFSLGRQISVEKDWISVICEGNSAKLASK